MTRLTGLAPLVTPATRVLVLGSFPGLRSLQRQQYYAHPQNQFWPVLRALWPQAPWPADGDYAGRCACALAQGLGIWDVYASCERSGSLDSAIRQAQLNDFPALLRALLEHRPDVAVVAVRPAPYYAPRPYYGPPAYRGYGYGPGYGYGYRRW